ncbi:hypothetical protein [Clostridium saccharobutylicum]|uniref:Uncharacterized protein n=1 Tax=Clostridium saccharobutylicum TaxID=169679 RepID=A0A1S8N5U9_CLOSA|nr:hypothetical protein [Clostridium saccharobutylicum]OOM11651.1 hypothetical protein CLOSAC_20780 [Clostridium saccharobutylicum]
MSELNKLQKDFFNTLNQIQEEAVSIAFGNYKEGDDIEDLLYDVTYNTIYSIMELIDGYVKDSLELDIIDRKNKESLRTGIELHDTCASFVKYEK